MTDWTTESIQVLLSCRTDAELLASFPGANIETLRRAQRLRRGSGREEASAMTTNNSNDKGRLSKIAELLEKSGIPLEEVGRIEKVRLGTYQMVTKDNEGEPHVHDLEANSLILTPAWADGPKWPVVQQARPTLIRPTTVRRRTPSGMKTAVILPDPQIGFRRLPDGALDPFHDERAMAIALQVITLTQPDVIVNLGDYLDFPMFGRFVQEPAFALTAQMSIDRGHKFLAEQRAAAPDSHIVVLEGNHDRRLQNFIINNAQAAFSLQRANQPSSWPVMSVPFLLRFEELGVEYVDAYPAGRYWLNDRLNCQHGHIVRSNGSTAKAIADDERVSSIHGHIHRIEMHYKTVNVRDGGRTNLAMSPGCLCRIDGTVPSTKGSTDIMGRPVTSFENWQQGLAVVTYQEGDSPFGLEHVYINDGFAIFRGQPIAA